MTRASRRGKNAVLTKAGWRRKDAVLTGASWRRKHTVLTRADGRGKDAVLTRAGRSGRGSVLVASGEVLEFGVAAVVVLVVVAGFSSLFDQGPLSALVVMERRHSGRGESGRWTRRSAAVAVATGTAGAAVGSALRGGTLRDGRRRVVVAGRDAVRKRAARSWLRELAALTDPAADECLWKRCRGRRLPALLRR